LLLTVVAVARAYPLFLHRISRYEVPHYPFDQLAVIAPVNLRETLGVKDGDVVTIEIAEA
jgi:CTP-dependent riboflavin kinase